MTIQRAKLSILVLVGSLGLLLASAAQAQTVTFNLVNAGLSGDDLAGVYTSPYQGSINGGSDIPVICDDFSDNSYVPETWTANVTQGSSLLSGTNTNVMWLNGVAGSADGTATTLMVDGYTLTQAEAYAVASVLAQQIVGIPLTGQTTTQQMDQEELSFALWGLFDPYGTLLSSDGAFNPNFLGGAAYASYLAGATTYLDDAVSQVMSNPSQVAADLSAITIYTYTDPSPTNPSCSGSPCPSSPPQEFITVPEPPFFLLLALGLILAMFLHFRKSISAMVFRPVTVNR